MDDSIFDSDVYTNAVKKEYRHACIAYLLSEEMFMIDCHGLGLDKKKLRKLIISDLKKLKKALLARDEILEHFFYDYPIETKKEEEKIKLSSFLYDLYNILALAVYLDNKYLFKTKNSKLDIQRLSNNLAISIIEGSAIGRYQSFNPYFGPTYRSQIGDIEHGFSTAHIFKEDDESENSLDGFYSSQNTFLMHQLLILVVLHNKYDIRPNISYNKIGQKNIITHYIENTPSSVPDNYLDDPRWSSSLINIITNFEFIMLDLKTRRKGLSPVKLGNIFFNQEFIEKFDFNKLSESYVFNEELMTEKIPTETSITETIGRIIDRKIQKYTNKKKVWSHVVKFMKFFPHQVANRKNNHIDFSDEDYIISIYNHNTTFGIKMGSSGQKETRLTYRELQDKFKQTEGWARSRLKYKELTSKERSTRDLRVLEYFENTYIF